MTTNGGGPPATPELYARMGAFVTELTQAGVLLASGGLDPKGTHFSAADGQVTMTDGPYAEAKESIVSFALIEARTEEEARELAQRFWSVVGDGEGDMRRVYGPGD